jgi:hypothetical protein
MSSVSWWLIAPVQKTIIKDFARAGTELSAAAPLQLDGRTRAFSPSPISPE